MKKTAKKLFGLLLALILTAGLLPVGAATARAEGEEVTAYPLWVGGVQVTSANLSGSGWSYEGDGTKGTLTLNKAKITGGYYGANVFAEGLDLTLSLKGANKLSGKAAGVEVSEASLTITGGGSLDASGSSYAIRVYGGDLSVTGGTVTATGGSFGISVDGGDLSFTGSTVTATGGSYGISVDGDLSIADSTVTAEASESSGYGIFAGQKLDENHQPIGGGRISISGSSAVSARGGYAAVSFAEDLSFQAPLSILIPEGGRAGSGCVLDANDNVATYALIGKDEKYAVTVEPSENGSVTADKTSVWAGETVTLTVTPDTDYALDSLTVSGEKGSVTVKDNKFTMPACDVTVTASFKPATYAVTVVDGTADKTEAAKGETVSVKAKAAPQGKVFDKWTGDDGVSFADATSAETTFVMPAKAVTVTATYKDVYAVTVVDGTADKTVAAAGETVSVTANAAPQGKIFDKWTGEGVSFADAGKTSTTFTMPANAVTVTATYKDVYAVTVENGTADKTEAAAGETVSVTAGDAPEGQVFDKWTGEGLSFADATQTTTTFVMPANAVTATATYKPATYTVKFETGGGSAVEDQTVEHGKKATKPADPTKKDYVFDGWYTDTTYKTAFDFNTAITADTTVHAKWKEEIKYTVVGTGSFTVSKGKATPLTITVKRNVNDKECFSHFASLAIDGKELVKDTDYTVKSGSTVITLKAATLNKLKTGNHTITVNFDDGKVYAKLTVKAGTGGGGKGVAPKTGDESNPLLWGALLGASALALCGTGYVLYRRKRKDKEDDAS